MPPRYVAVSINPCPENEGKETLYGSEEEIKKFIESLPNNNGKLMNETIREIRYIKKSFDYMEGFELKCINSQGEPYELNFYSALLSQILLRDGDKFELCASG